MKKKTHSNNPLNNEVTYHDMIEAAIRQGGKGKTILADLETLLKLRNVVRQIQLKQLYIDTPQELANYISK